MIIKLLVLVLFSIEYLYAFESFIPEIEWQHTYGGSDGELCRDACLTHNDGFVLVGITESFSPGHGEIYVVRANSFGDTVWTESIDLSRTTDRAFSVFQTHDDCLILAGNGVDAFLLKLDPEGNILWHRNYSLEPLSIKAESVIQTFDGDFVIVGTGRYSGYRSDVFLIRTDAQGDTLWTKTYGTKFSERANSIQQTSDGGFIITGSTNSVDSDLRNSNLLLIKTDENGNITWSRDYGGVSYEVGSSVIQTMNGGYIVAGITGSYGAGEGDVFIIRTTFNGDTLWTRTFGGSEHDWGDAIIEVSPGQYLAASTSGSFGPGSSSLYLIRIDDLGDTQWTSTIGDGGTDWCSDVAQTRDGGFVLAGNTCSYGQGDRDFYVIKLKPELEFPEYQGFEYGPQRISCFFPERLKRIMLISYYSFKQFGDTLDFSLLFRKLAVCVGIDLHIESTVELCKTAGSYYHLDILDTVHSLREDAWIHEHIPYTESQVPHLHEYDEFAITELFRAITIEELEISLADEYPYQWLEEILKNNTIPWEDRYWLDRRIRAAIAQNLHVFYDTDNNPVHVEADAFYPGEFYWREHVIADPIGWNVSKDDERPVELEDLDIGYLYDLYGYPIGKLAISSPDISLSREADVGIIQSGGSHYEYPDHPPYACFLYPDGRFREVPLLPEMNRDYVLSADGHTAVFISSTVSVFDEIGNLSQSIELPEEYSPFRAYSVITEDGGYLACNAGLSGAIALTDIENKSIQLISDPMEFSSKQFSPDGQYLCLSGGYEQPTHAELYDIHTGNSTSILVDTIPPSSSICTSSNSGSCIAVTSRYKGASGYYVDLDVFINGERYSYYFEPHRVYATPVTDISPNGNFLIMNPFRAAHGRPNAYDDPREGNVPLVVMQITGG